MFCGKSFNVIDDKNRLMIPQQFRTELGAVAYITLGYDSNLFMMSEERFNALAEKVNAIPETLPESRQYKRMFFGNAVQCELDKQGRVLIPQMLLEQVGITKDVVVIGVSDKLEIWDRETYKNDPNGAFVQNKSDMLVKISEHGV